MCDWEAEEYAEYLLWVEAETARARARARSHPERSAVKLTSAATSPLEAVEA